MARILPDVSAATGPLTPTRQRFFNKVESDEDKALKIMQAISGGVRTASDLYAVGSDIYDKYIKETPEEALRRRQEEIGDAATRQRIARNVAGPGGMVGGQYDPMLGSRVPEFPLKPAPTQSGFAQAQKEFAQDFAATDQETFIPGRTKPAPFTETPEGAPAEAAAPAPATTALDESEVIVDLGKLGRLLPQYAAQRGMNAAEAQKMVYDGDFRRRNLAPGSAETFGQYLDRMQQSGQFGGAPAGQVVEATSPEAQRLKKLTDRVEQAGRPDLVPHVVKRAQKAAEDAGRPDLAAKFQSILEKSGGPESAAFEFIEQRGRGALLDQPRTASEFALGFEAGEDFAVGDLNMAYRSLWNAGRQQEAEELVGLAAASMDIGQFVKSGNEPRSLIIARARQAIRKGADVGGVTGAQAVKLATSAAKRRRRRATPGGGTKRPTLTGPLTEEEKGNRSFVIVAGFDGLSSARKTLYGKKSGDPSTKQSRLSARARTIEKEVTQEELNRLTITSGGEEIRLSNLFSNIGKSRSRATADADAAAAAEAVKSKREGDLSTLLRKPIKSLDAAAVAAYVAKNEPLAKMKFDEYVRSQILKQKSKKAYSWEVVKSRYGLSRKDAVAKHKAVKDNLVKVQNLANQLGLAGE